MKGFFLWQIEGNFKVYEVRGVFRETASAE
jgi:hypothetical protein